MTRHTPHQGLWNADPARTRDEAPAQIVEPDSIESGRFTRSVESLPSLLPGFSCARISEQRSARRSVRERLQDGAHALRENHVLTAPASHGRAGRPTGSRGGGVDPAPAGPDPLLSVASLFALSLRGRADLPDHARVGDLEERTVTVAHEP